MTSAESSPSSQIPWVWVTYCENNTKNISDVHTRSSRRTNLVTQVLEARIPVLPLPALPLVPVNHEVQQVDGLDHLVEHGSVPPGGGDGEPSCAAGDPDAHLAVVVLAVGVVSHIVDDNPFRKVVLVEHCREPMPLASPTDLDGISFKRREVSK